MTNCQTVGLEPGETQELDALRFVTQIAGAEQIRIAVTVKTSAKIPLGRWAGAVVITVEDEEQKPQAGRDVIIVGGALPSSNLPEFDNLLGGGSGWKSLDLQPDRNFNRRLVQACPPASDPMPSLSDPSRAWPTGVTAQGALLIRDRYTGAAGAVGGVCGTSASLGRGGDQAIAWWLQPAPYDAYQHGRLSRRHATVALGEGRAWLTDWSANGTWLNGERVTKAESCLVADGDRLDPAHVVPFKVELLASRNQVHAIWLHRIDALGDQFRYLLADAQMPIPFALPGQSEPSLWLAWQWTRSGGAEALICTAQATTFQSIEEFHDQSLTDRYSLMWQSYSAPVEQSDTLRQLNALA